MRLHDYTPNQDPQLFPKACKRVLVPTEQKLRNLLGYRKTGKGAFQSGKVTMAKLRQIASMVEAEVGISTVAKECRCSKDLVYRVREALGLKQA